jgi:hypothetical protein
VALKTNFTEILAKQMADIEITRVLCASASNPYWDVAKDIYIRRAEIALKGLDKMGYRLVRK